MAADGPKLGKGPAGEKSRGLCNVTMTFNGCLKGPGSNSEPGLEGEFLLLLDLIQSVARCQLEARWRVWADQMRCAIEILYFTFFWFLGHTE